jgi:transposase
VHQVQVPWAREGSGFTLMMEALMMLLSAEMPVDAMADLLDEHDTRLWRVLMHYVDQAHAKSDWSAVRRIAVDETSARRGHRYVTNVLNAENSSLLLMVEGRSAEALGAFAKALGEHGGDPSQIEAIAMDMSPAYVKGRPNTFLRPGSSSTSSISWCWPAKRSMRCAASLAVMEPSSKGHSGACAATLGT